MHTKYGLVTKLKSKVSQNFESQEVWKYDRISCADVVAQQYIKRRINI